MASRAYREAHNKLHEVYHLIGGLSGRQLTRLEREVSEQSEANTWWLAFRAKPLLLTAIARARALNKPIKRGKNHANATGVK